MMRLTTPRLVLSCGAIMSILLAMIHTVTPQSTNTSLACPSNASSACIQSFRTLYALGPTDTSLDETLAQNLTCFNYASSTSDNCLKPVSAGNCSVISNALSSNQTLGYGLVCTTVGQLMIFTSSLNCSDVTSTFYQAFIGATTAFCSTKINNTLTCSTVSGTEYIDETSLLNAASKADDCDVMNTTTHIASVTKTTTQIPMLLNPVGPAAITAIVVVGCLFITCILATFFFWPKCHISQAPPLPKKVMKTNGAAVGFCPVAAGVEVYDGPVSVNAV